MCCEDVENSEEATYVSYKLTSKPSTAMMCTNATNHIVLRIHILIGHIHLSAYAHYNIAHILCLQLNLPT